ncbi:MAG: rhodanese-like domain-containing protein [Thioalkalivibrionaceae bacterium]
MPDEITQSLQPELAPVKRQLVLPLSPVDAYERIRHDPRALFIDVRSTMEFLFVGHPIGAIHIPWIDEPDWTENPRFAAEVRKRLLGGVDDHDPPAIVLICRSGKRTLAAGQALIDAGLPNPIYHIESGFEGPLNDQHQRSKVAGWRFAGLPWEQC